MRKALPIILSSLFIIFIALCLRPIQNSTLADCEKVEGVLHDLVPNEPSKDIGIRLQGDDHRYYVNRGLERQGLLNVLENSIGKAIEIYPVIHWTPLDPTGKSRHLAQIVVEGEVIFTEFRHDI